MMLKILSATAFSLCLVHAAQAQEATTMKTAPAAKATPQERADARAQRRAEGKLAVRDGNPVASGDAGEAAVAQSGPSTSAADRQAARQKRRAAMADAQHKHEIPASNEAK